MKDKNFNIKDLKYQLNVTNILWISLFFVTFIIHMDVVSNLINYLNKYFQQPWSSIVGLIILSIWFFRSPYNLKCQIVKWSTPLVFWSLSGLRHNGLWQINVVIILFLSVHFIFVLTILFHLALTIFGRNTQSEMNQGLISDDPIESNEENDSFNRRDYARSIVSEIRKTVNKRAFNIAITGAWGSGKTSFLNLIKGEMDKTENNEKVKFITVNYNPWDFKEDKIIGLDLLKTISHELANEKELQEKFKGLMVSLQGMNQSPWYKVIPYFLSGFSVEKSINKYREEIGKALQEQNKKLVIFLDDLDRLDDDEILEVFKTIRNSFDIANTFFILGFDIDYVIDQIKDKVKGERALEYLDKIFQMRLFMPSNADFDFIGILEKEVGITIDEYAKIHCPEFFKLQLRNINKIINGIKIFKAHTKNFSDFNASGLVMLEILKSKNPAIYSHFVYELGHLIPKKYFREYYKDYKYRNIEPTLSDLYIGLQTEDKLKTPLLYILYFILPDIYNDKTFSLDYNKYFKFSLPQSFISVTEMKKALEEKDDGYFNNLIGTSKHFHMRLCLERHLLELLNSQDSNLEFTLKLLFNINASIVPSLEELATSHYHFIEVFKSNLENPENYNDAHVSHFVASLESHHRIFFSAKFWYLDEKNLLKIIHDEIEVINNDEEKLIYLFVTVFRAISSCSDPNLTDRKKELVEDFRGIIKNKLNDNIVNFSLNWLKPFIFSISTNNNHRHFSFLNWLFTSNEFINMLDKNDPKHAELIRWLGNEFIIGREYKFYFIDYEYVFEEKYYLYPYNSDDLI